LLFKFALEYGIRRVQVNQDVLKLNDTHQLPVDADDVNQSGGSIHTKKKRKKTEALAVASKKIGLVVKAEKTKYMVTSRDQNAGRSYNIMNANCSFEMAESSNIWEQP